MKAEAWAALCAIGTTSGVERDWLMPWCDEVQVVQDLTMINDTSAEMLFAA